MHSTAHTAAEPARNHDTAAFEDHANLINWGRVEVVPAGRTRPGDAPKDSSLSPFILTLGAWRGLADQGGCDPPSPQADRLMLAQAEPGWQALLVLAYVRKG
jgi:hypothetical protein